MTSNLTALELASDREIVITRTFRGRAQTVFDAWTKPELVRRWWAPASRGVRFVECDADVRAGGQYRYVLVRGDDEPFSFLGTYLEVERPIRLVYTQSFSPSPGVVLPAEATITVTFEERDGSTTVIAREMYPSKEVRDGVLETGMEDGMRESYEQLAALVVELSV